MEVLSSGEFGKLHFVEKKAMLDFAIYQMVTLKAGIDEAKRTSDQDTVDGLTYTLTRWVGYANALSTECELHIQAALGGENFTPPM